VDWGKDMFGKETLRKQSSPYATREDFSRIFERDINSLYCLSLLLTGDEAIAEQCFVGALHIAQEGTRVFKDWAETWARRTIILNAIRMIPSRRTADSAESIGRVAGDTTAQVEIAEVAKLSVLEEFAFVMSVLEGYSDYECALHLGRTRAEVTAARTRALERIASAAEFREHPKTISSAQRQQETDSGSEAQSQPSLITAATA
jgi:DNA-directed RNA polymerase specialized sigma24 family protein